MSRNFNSPSTCNKYNRYQIVQHVNEVIRTDWTSTAYRSTPAKTTLVKTITPKYADSLIFIEFMASANEYGGSSYGGHLYFYKNGVRITPRNPETWNTAGSTGASAHGFWYHSPGMTDIYGSQFMRYVDRALDTEPKTYEIWASRHNGTKVHLHNSWGNPQLSLTEYRVRS